MSAHLAAIIMAGCLHIVFAVFVLLASPRDRLSRSFFVLFILLAVLLFGDALIYSSENAETAISNVWLYEIGIDFVLPALLLFVYSFSLQEISSKLSKHVVSMSFVLAIALFIFDRTPIVKQEALRVAGGYYIRAYPAQYFLIALFTYCFALIAYLLITTFRSASPFQRKQMVLMFGGITIASLFFLSYTSAPFGIVVPPIGYIGSAVASSVAFYAIVRYKLFGIAIYIRKGLVYTVTTLSLTGIYLSTLFLSTGRISPSGSVLGVPRYILLILCLAIVFEPVCNSAQTLVDRLFFRTLSEQGRAIETFSKTLVRITDLSILLKKALDLIVGNFKLNLSSIWLINASNKCYLAQVDGLDKDFLGQDVSVRLPLIDKAQDGLVVLAHDYSKSQHSAIRQSLNEVKSSVAIPLISKNRLLGLLFLGDKVGGRHLSGSEILLLKGLADHLALTIENSLISDPVESDVDIGTERSRRARRASRGEQTRPLLQKGLVYSITTAVATSPLIAVFYHWSEDFARANQIDKIWGVAATVVVLTAVYEPIRGLTNTLVDRYFYRRDAILRERVQEFASMAVSILDLDILLHQTVNRVKEIMGARWVILMLPTPEGTFKSAAYSGLDDSVVADIALSPVSQIIGHVSEAGSAVLDSRNNHTLYRLTVPILMGGQLSGLLVLGDRDNKQYSAEDMRLMNILAGQLAIAIRNAELYRKTATDGLTRLYNRAYFDIRLEKAIKNARQDKTPLSVIIMDVDGFMPFSFENGRMAAEQALIDIAQTLKKRMAKYDVIARFGEDEFSVILPGEGEESARFVARNVKRTVDGLAIQGQNGKRKLSVSAGVATMKDDSDTCHKLTGRALTALQESKTVIESGEGPA